MILLLIVIAPSLLEELVQERDELQKELESVTTRKIELELLLEHSNDETETISHEKDVLMEQLVQTTKEREEVKR